MNRNQKIVLIIGAVLLLIVIFTTPQVITIGNEGSFAQVDAGSDWGRELVRQGHHKSIDLQTWVLRGAGVIVATLFVWYALRSK